MAKLSEPKAKQIVGVAGLNTHRGQIRADEFDKTISGNKAIKKFREMRDNDATIGAIMYAVEQVLRDVPFKVKPYNESEEAKNLAFFVEEVLDDMEHSFDDHITEALSCLSYGFSLFEVVYKRREGENLNNKKKHSKYTDGKLGIRKLSSRAQWTISSFDIDDEGDLQGVRQSVWKRNSTSAYIPSTKLLHYRTTSLNNDPSGRSVLRNAYKSYTYLCNLQEIEAIAIEREMHGIPHGTMPSEYLSPDATEDQVAVRKQVESILSGLKSHQYQYALTPSDPFYDSDGKVTNHKIMDIKLITADGNRAIDIDPVIKRYQNDIARSVMAEFLMLGNGSGSYALSKSKTDLFLRSLEAYINSIFDVLNKQLIEPLIRLNGFNISLCPKLCAGDVAPHDLKELGSYLRNLNGANIDLTNQLDTVEDLMDNADLRFDREIYNKKLEEKKEFTETQQQMKNSKNNFPDSGDKDENT